MEKITSIETIRKIQLGILDSIHDFCALNNITYYLGYGTLLGAVRHEGYIPWDDDLDILMSRDDYEVFLKMYNKSQQSIYILSDIKTEGYNLPFCKVFDKRTKLVEDVLKHDNNIGVYVDVFPIDGLPKRHIFQRIHFARIKYYEVLLKKKTYKKFRTKNFIFNTIIFGLGILNIFNSQQNIMRKINKIAMKYPFNFSSEVAVTVWGYGLREIMNSEIFASKKKVKFEGKCYYIPIKYDLYLSNIYGDYMKLPEIEDRVMKHNFNAYWTEEKI